MRYIPYIVRQFMLALFIVCISFASGNSEEIDDATVFVDAFNAYQQKDYLLTIEKCDQLNQVFPDSPLRDVTLLLTARASLKSGDDERAAKSVTLFLTEFPDSSLKTSVEDELEVLATRYQKGEVLACHNPLQAAARKVRSDRIARERAAALKQETERIAKAKAEQELAARIKVEAENREKERVSAEKRAKASIKATIMLHESAGPFPAGGNGTLPFEVSNGGKTSEDFFLSIMAAPGYDAILTSAIKPDENISRLHLAAGETFRGSIAFKMPAEIVDGQRSIVIIRAISTKFSDISFQNKTVLISSAPLVRAVAKLARRKVTPGEKLHYRVTVLNAGSLAAHDLTVRLQLPPKVEFQGTSDVPFKKEPNGTLNFTIDQIETGKLAEINLDVKIREDCAVGDELRGHVEVGNVGSPRKAIFTANASVVQAK